MLSQQCLCSSHYSLFPPCAQRVIAAVALCAMPVSPARIWLQTIYSQRKVLVWAFRRWAARLHFQSWGPFPKERCFSVPFSLVDQLILVPDYSSYQSPLVQGVMANTLSSPLTPSQGRGMRTLCHSWGGTGVISSFQGASLCFREHQRRAPTHSITCTAPSFLNWGVECCSCAILRRQGSVNQTSAVLHNVPASRDRWANDEFLC